MSRLAHGGLAAITLCAAAAGCGGGDTRASGDRSEIVFGSVLELSGSQQIWGRPSKDGREAAVEAINADGGIEVDGARYDVALKIADNRSDPSVVASAAQDVVAANAVAATTPDISAPVAYEAFKQAGIITFTAGFDLQVTLQKDPKGNPLLFSSTPFYSEIYTDSMKRVARSFPQIRRVAILSPDNEGGKGALESYAAGAQAAGMQVVHRALYPFNTTDFSAVLTAIKGKSPDLVIALQSREQAITIMQQANDLGVAQYALNDAMTPTDVLNANGLDGLTVMIPGFGPTYSDAATIPDYDPRAAFGDKDPSIPIAAILAYYTLQLTAQAIEAAGTTEDGTAIANALVGQSHDGPFGTCTVGERRDVRCETLFETVRGGQVEVLRYPDPGALQPSTRYVCRDGSCRRR